MRGRKGNNTRWIINANAVTGAKSADGEIPTAQDRVRRDGSQPSLPQHDFVQFPTGFCFGSESGCSNARSRQRLRLRVGSDVRRPIRLPAQDSSLFDLRFNSTIFHYFLCISLILTIGSLAIAPGVKAFFYTRPQWNVALFF